MTASPLSTQVRPGTSELINIFKNVNLIECGAVLNIPNISTIDSTNLIPTNHIKGWAKVSLGGKVVR
ncbi:MAG TPA: hypothetical protein VIE65_04285, partial [Methylobacter sp.]